MKTLKGIEKKYLRGLAHELKPLVLIGKEGITDGIVRAIEDPLPRLIAAGLAVSHRLENDAILQTAVETASRNGWKRALLAWLERLKSSHEAAGDAAKASAIKSRIDLMK